MDFLCRRNLNILQAPNHTNLSLAQARIETRLDEYRMNNVSNSPNMTILAVPTPLPPKIICDKKCTARKYIPLKFQARKKSTTVIRTPLFGSLDFNTGGNQEQVQSSCISIDQRHDMSVDLYADTLGMSANAQANYNNTIINIRKPITKEKQGSTASSFDDQVWGEKIVTVGLVGSVEISPQAISHRVGNKVKAKGNKRQNQNCMNTLVPPIYPCKSNSQKCQKMAENYANHSAKNNKVRKELFTFSQMEKNDKASCEIQHESYSERRQKSYRYLHPAKIAKGPFCKDDFLILKELGHGSYARVVLACERFTGLIFAIKILNKAYIKEKNMLDQVVSQIKIQSFVSSPNIVTLYGYFNDQQNIYLIMEPALDTRIQSKLRSSTYTELEALTIFKQVVEAVACLHSQRVIHRDIKLENILAHEGVMKLCDFGWSVYLGRHAFRQTICGTPLYLSPQVLRGDQYDESIDIWALGVLQYELLHNSNPFHVRTMHDLQFVGKKRITYKPETSQEMKQLIGGCLQTDPKARLNAETILMNPLIQAIEAFQ